MSDMLAWQTLAVWICRLSSRRGKQEVLFHSKIKQGSQNYCYRYYYYYYFSYYYYCPYVLLDGSFKLFVPSFPSLADKILEEIGSNESTEDATLARKFIAAVKCRTIKPEAITVDLAVKGK